MHWLVGIELVNLCSIGCPLSFFGMVGSGLSLDVYPRLPCLAYCAEWTGERSLA